jgi:hypothetical protein
VVATLVLHLLYGVILGATLDSDVAVPLVPPGVSSNYDA